MAATIFYDDTNSTVKLFDLKNDHETLKLTVAHIEAGDGNYSPASPASISTPTVSLNPSTYDHPSNPHRQLCHGECVLSDWHKFVDILNQSQEICLDGTALDIPSVVAVARWVSTYSKEIKPFTDLNLSVVMELVLLSSRARTSLIRLIAA